MISGLNSSGIASAIRTAGQARATMDTMTRQIATGQKVASVKDDGAAWARAAGLRAQKAQIQGRETILSLMSSVAAAQGARAEQSDAMQQRMIDIVTQAMSYAAGSQARAALGAEWDQIYAGWIAARVPDNPVSGSTSVGNGVWGIRGTSADPLLDTVRVHSLDHRSWADNGHHTTDYATNGVPINAIDVRNGSAANLTNGLATLRMHLFAVVPPHSAWGADTKTLERAQDWSKQEEARLDGAIGSLTDADLGKASAARAQAETRQQLALSTVRQAISAYGNYASGLLGNAQRTQRGIIA